MVIALRRDFDAHSARAAAKRAKDAAQARRLLALAAIYEGASRAKAAELGGVTRQIIRDWVVRFNMHGPEGLVDRKAPGQPARLNEAQRAALVSMIEAGPPPTTHSVAGWRLVDLCQRIFEEFHITIAKQTMSRELRAMGYRKLPRRRKSESRAEREIGERYEALPGGWRKSKKARSRTGA